MNESQAPEMVKVKNPGPGPQKGKRQMSWAPVRELEVGEAVDLPTTANLQSASVQLSKMNRAGDRRYTRKGFRIWRAM
jgi:hypothetical protein